MGDGDDAPDFTPSDWAIPALPARLKGSSDAAVAVAIKRALCDLPWMLLKGSEKGSRVPSVTRFRWHVAALLIVRRLRASHIHLATDDTDKRGHSTW